MTITNESKPGYLTTEFWLVLITNVLTQLGALPVPDSRKWVVTLATIVGYALSRAIAKHGQPEVSVPIAPANPAAIAPDQGDAGPASTPPA